MNLSGYLLNVKTVGDCGGQEKLVADNANRIIRALDSRIYHHLIAGKENKYNPDKYDGIMSGVWKHWANKKDALTTLTDSQMQEYVENICSEYNLDADEIDWMARLQKSRAFQNIPDTNIHMIFMRMRPVEVHAGDVILKQGDKGDYYYIVRQGCCKITRNTDAGETTLKELRQGDSFGEESLLSDAPRNATVTMLTDGVLIRLPKDSFVSLLKAPVLNSISYSVAAPMMQNGVTCLDVRTPEEYRNNHLNNSINLPLWTLRNEVDNLDTKRPYIVYCDDGSRSAAAAYLLSERGFDVYVLNGGLAAVQDDLRNTKEELKGSGTGAGA